MDRERVVERLLLVRSGREVEPVREGGERKRKAEGFGKPTMRTKSAVSGSRESLGASYVLRRGWNLVTTTEVMWRSACGGYAGQRSYGLRNEQHEKGKSKNKGVFAEWPWIARRLACQDKCVGYHRQRGAERSKDN